ncbi:MAG: DUF748 domain-containing protein [Candidatus Omnitrophica bacterium]|nr:DUF748 domain-containing protein [Candidatus Omnitrophota bacterium]
MKKPFYLIIIILSLILLGVFFTLHQISAVVKNISMRELSKIITTKAECDNMSVDLFKGIVRFSGLRAENPAGYNDRYFVDINRGYVDLSLRSLAAGNVRIEKIYLDRPEVNLEINKDGVSNAKLVFKKKAVQETPEAVQKKSGNGQGLSAGLINIRGGVFKLVNFKVNPEGVRFLLDQIDITIKNLRKPDRQGGLPSAVICSARLPADGGNGRILLDGTGDFLSALTSFDLSLKASDISLDYFTPFYILKAPVFARQGRLDLISNGRCANNVLDASQKVTIRDLELIVNRENADNNSIFGVPIMAVMNYLMNSQGVLDFDFAVTGTLSNPEFHIGEALKKVLARSIGNAILNQASDLPGQILQKSSKEGISVEDAGKQVLKDVLDKIMSSDKEPKQ